MRAALGLALVAGGGMLVLLILRGRTPFDGTSLSGGSAPAPEPVASSEPGTAKAATNSAQHFGGLP